jgi:hypothetical protein
MSASDEGAFNIGGRGGLAGLASAFAPGPADLLLINGRVYTLSWNAPDREGHPAPNAPHDARGWHPDAEAVAVRGESIALVGFTASPSGATASRSSVRVSPPRRRRLKAARSERTPRAARPAF